jgi:DNA-binding response OmpR family regulator
MSTMKKILIAHSLRQLISGKHTPLSRGNFKIFTAATTEDIFSVHKAHGVDIIIANMDMPGRPLDELISVIRRDDDLKKVSIIVICAETAAAWKRCSKCGANVVFAAPLDREKLLQKISGLLNISERKSMREIVKISVNVRHKNALFFAVSGNISTSGMLLEMGRVLSEGDRVTCSFVLQYQVTVKGEIVRAEKKSEDLNLYGVRFLDIDQSAKAQIEEFLNKKKGNV